MLLLLYCQSCLGTFVVDLNQPSNEDRKTFLALDKGIEINNELTFCLRLNIKDVLKTNYIFSSTDDNLSLILRFSVSQGLVLINGVALFFEIPEDNGVLPFHWHHICFSSNKDSHTIVLDGGDLDGHIWHQEKNAQGSVEKKTVTRLDLGSTNDYWVYPDGIEFKGLLSELNIWSKSLSVPQMKNITKKCGKVDPIPDLLNWSELPSSVIRGSKYNENIGNICSQSNTTSLIYKVMSGYQDPDNAMRACKILNGELAFPNSKDELLTWNGKLLRMKCINIKKKLSTKYLSIFL